MMKYEPIFVFFQEHWIPHHDAPVILKSDFPNYNFLTTSEDMFIPTEDLLLNAGPVWQGTAIGWSMDIDMHVTKLPVISERFCGIQYKDVNSGYDILAYSVYMPTAGKDSEFLEVMSSLSVDITANRTTDTTILIGCDSNQSKKSTNRRTSAMNKFLDEYDLSSILTSDKPTFHHNNQTSESKIDHIYYFIPKSSKAKIEFHEHLCLKENPSNLSAHDVIVGNINIPKILTSNSSEDLSSSYTQFPVKKIKWDESGLAGYQSQTARIMTEMFDRFNLAEHIPLLSEMCSKMLVLSAEKNFESSNPKNAPKQKGKSPFFSKDHKDAYHEHELICRKWRLAGRPTELFHPAKAAKLASQRNQKISRNNESSLKI